MSTCIEATLALLVGVLWAGVAVAEQESVRADESLAIPRSEVVFMGSRGTEMPALYEAYGTTLVSWGGHPHADTEEAVAGFVNSRIKPARERDIRYCTSVGFRTAFARMIDFDADFMDSVIRDLDNEPVLVPWLWDHRHKDGHPAYWFCTSAPGYRKFLKHEVALAVKANPHGLHVDDYAGTTSWSGGCFCRYCMRGFREYLRTSVEPETLQALDIDNLQQFDYGDFLRSRGITGGEVRSARHTLPLYTEYNEFLHSMNTDWLLEAHRYAEELRGGKLLLSVNSNPAEADQMLIGPHVDYFCGEVPHGAGDRETSETPVFAYKMAEALGRSMACTVAGQDWAYVAEHNRAEMVRGWIAQAYAFGHSIMAPYNQWAYTKEKGTHWYVSEPGDYAPVYRFVRENARLFDGYDSISQVALVVSYPALRRHRTGVRKASQWLAEHNVPYELVLAGDHLFPPRLSEEQFAPFGAVVVVGDHLLAGAQEMALASARDKLVHWPEDMSDGNALEQAASKLRRLVPVSIEVEGATGIMVVPRVSEAKDAPIVLHLLNKNYTEADDKTMVIDRCVIRIRSDLCDVSSDVTASLYTVGDRREMVPVEVDEGWHAFRLSHLGFWGVLALEPTVSR